MIGSKTSAERRLLEERLYAEVVQELSQGIRRDGLWAKAIANSNGSDGLAKSLYIRYRVQSILDEMEISEKQDQIHRKIKQNERTSEVAKERQEHARIRREKVIATVGKFLFSILAIISVMGCFSGLIMVVALMSKIGLGAAVLETVPIFVMNGLLLYWSIKKLREN